MKSENLPEKALLVLDNAPSHPSESVLKSKCGNIFVKYLPPNVTALIQPMDQGVIASVKRNYRSTVLKKMIEEGSDLKSFFKNFTLLDAIYECDAAWKKVKASSLTKSWKKILPDICEEADFAGFDDATNEPTPAELAQISNAVPGGENVDEENIVEWLQCDKDLPGFEALSDEQILRRATGEADAESESEGEDEGGEEREGDSQSAVAKAKVTHSAALQHVESLIDYLDGQPDTLLCDIMTLRKIRSNLLKKATKKQTTITQFFVRN